MAGSILVLVIGNESNVMPAPSCIVLIQGDKHMSLRNNIETAANLAMIGVAVLLCLPPDARPDTFGGRLRPKGPAPLADVGSAAHLVQAWPDDGDQARRLHRSNQG
ncbi:hypothetical protein SBA3_1240015 [Candidatus Sulfopaludibacter sp. SbA3]|nr:hypothetical protein SBA3_1240015 [Candidatus Sulfopaludibacter sp. SbA3]